MTQLVCFEKADLKIDAEIKVASFLVLKMKIKGDVRHLKIPRVKKKPSRKHDLWKHTCFEAFIRPKDQSFYWEINCSPSGDWNVYRFEAYREGMRPVRQVRLVRQVGTKTTFDFSNVPDFPKKMSEANFNLAAILENKNGTKTHWALKHLAQKPDFHLF